MITKSTQATFPSAVILTRAGNNFSQQIIIIRFIQNEFEVKFSPDIAEQGFSIWISDSFLKHFFVVLTSLRFVQESHFSLIQLLHLMCEPFRLESTFQQINYTWMTTIPKIYNVLHME